MWTILFSLSLENTTRRHHRRDGGSADDNVMLEAAQKDGSQDAFPLFSPTSGKQRRRLIVGKSRMCLAGWGGRVQSLEKFLILNFTRNFLELKQLFLLLDGTLSVDLGSGPEWWESLVPR